METIIRILVENILVFAYSREDQIAEDFSVQQLEHIAQALLALDDATIQIFLQVVRSMAFEARTAGSNDRAEQLDEMPSHLGLE